MIKSYGKPLLSGADVIADMLNGSFRFLLRVVSVFWGSRSTIVVVKPKEARCW